MNPEICICRKLGSIGNKNDCGGYRRLAAIDEWQCIWSV